METQEILNLINCYPKLQHLKHWSWEILPDCYHRLDRDPVYNFSYSSFCFGTRVERRFECILSPDDQRQRWPGFITLSPGDPIYSSERIHHSGEVVVISLQIRAGEAFDYPPNGYLLAGSHEYECEKENRRWIRTQKKNGSYQTTQVKKRAAWKKQFESKRGSLRNFVICLPGKSFHQYKDQFSRFLNEVSNQLSDAKDCNICCQANKCYTCQICTIHLCDACEQLYAFQNKRSFLCFACLPKNLRAIVAKRWHLLQFPCDLILLVLSFVHDGNLSWLTSFTSIAEPEITVT